MPQDAPTTHLFAEVQEPMCTEPAAQINVLDARSPKIKVSPHRTALNLPMALHTATRQLQQQLETSAQPPHAPLIHAMHGKFVTKLELEHVPQFLAPSKLLKNYARPWYVMVLSALRAMLQQK